MNYLLDTHIFLWAIFTPEKITQKIRSLILAQEPTKFVSIVTFWEISMKFSIGKINLEGVLPDELPKIAADAGFEILSLHIDTASSFYKLPKLRNKDPFDRMLAWQAIHKDCHLLTQDVDFAGYKVHGLRMV